MDIVTNDHKDDDHLTKILRRLYPHGAFEPPPDGFADGIHVDVTLQFGWVDRLKMLLGYDVSVRLLTWTENAPGACHTEEPRINIFFPWRLRKLQLGVVEVPPNKDDGGA